MDKAMCSAARSAAVVLGAMIVFSATGSVAAAVVLQEGTEVPIRFNDALSSKTNTEGDRFSITLDDEIVLPNGTHIPAGYRGVGEVTSAHKRGMVGKAGDLNVRFDYIKIGDAKVRLRGNKGSEGQSKVGTTIVLTVLFGPLGLLKHGKDVEIKAGQRFMAYVDSDADIEVPLAPPPAGG